LIEKEAFVYRITNLINGMQYIGVTVNPVNRFRSHCRNVGSTRLLLKNAILKYGKENFKMKLLLKASQKYCYEIEPKIIELYNTLNPNGYNLSKGGMGSLGLVGEMNGCYGRTGDAHPNFGKKGYRSGMLHTEETKAKMRASRAGRKHSEETKAKMAEAGKRRFSDPVEKQRMKQLGFLSGRPRKSSKD
jgi:group I intron endonuclease